MRSLARAPHYRHAEPLLRNVDRLDASEIGRSPSVQLDDYTFHPSGATLLLRAERLLR